MTRRQSRLSLIVAALALLGIATGLALYALRDNVVFFMSPSEVAAKAPTIGQRLRIGGLVAANSVKHGAGEKLNFDVTDGKATLHVTFDGLPPDLFREGQGVVAEGSLSAPDALAADTILAKHDERYMPREVVDALKKEGRWQEGSQ
jgi:cytochrome c-type biogenesis protein CcmE